MNEIWKDIEGYGGEYQVSNLGRVRSCKKGEWKTLKQGKHIKGYLMVMLYANNKSTPFTVHRLVCEAFIGPRPNGKVINHKNSNKTDNSISNLEYVSKKENYKHAFISGKINLKGERQSNSVLTDKQALEILNIRKEKNLTYSKIAEIYNVSEHVVGKLIRRQSYTHLIPDK